MKTLDKRQLDVKFASNDNAILIDVLNTEYFTNEHIQGAINIPNSAVDFVEQVQNKVSSKDAEIVVYCYSTQCDASEKAADKLEDAGFTNVFRFTGGLTEWKEKGGKTEGSKTGLPGKAMKTEESSEYTGCDSCN